MVAPCVVLVETDLLFFAPFFFSLSNVEFKNHQAWRGNRIRRCNPVSSVGQSNQGPVGAVVELQRSRERRTVFVAPRQCNQTGWKIYRHTILLQSFGQLQIIGQLLQRCKCGIIKSVKSVKVSRYKRGTVVMVHTIEQSANTVSSMCNKLYIFYSCDYYFML